MSLLKKRAVQGDQIGLINFYLQAFGEHLPIDVLEEMHVEVLKAVFENMHQVPLVDICSCLQSLSLIGDEHKAMRFVTKLQNLIEFTLPRLVKSATPEAIHKLLVFFKQIDFESPEFKNACAKLIAYRLEKGDVLDLGSQEICDLMSCLSDIDWVPQKELF